MLSISAPMKGAGAGNYYLALARDDYYANAREQPGRWFGQGAQLLGLAGRVRPGPFLHLLSGCSPDGKSPLVQNARASDRQSGWDLTFSAPKSVSVFWALAPPEIRQQVETCHYHAVETALNHLQQTCAFTRRGSGGKITEPAAVVVATFLHITSRAQDPQIHTHAVLANLALRQDGTTGTLLSRPFFEQKMALGALYQTDLAAGLRRELGLRIEPERVGFHVAGVPHGLCRELSKRRHQIEAVLAERGQHSALAAKAAALDTRPGKDRASRADLFARWQQVGEAYGWKVEHALDLTRRAPPPEVNRPRFDQEVHAAIEALPEPCRTPARVVRAAAQVATRHGADARTLLDSLATLVRCQSLRLPKLLHVEWRRLFDRTPWVPARGKFLDLETFHPFAHAPWGPARNLKLHRVVLELPRVVWGAKKPFPSKWWRIHWKRDLLFGELRVQERILFPHAPKWSPLHGLSVRALHLTPRKSKWQPLEPERDRDQKRDRHRSYGQSH